MLRNGSHPCVGLLRAFTKYGEEQLVFAILESLPLSSSTDLVRLREQEWWDTLKAQGVKLYNGRPTGTGSVFHTDESKAKIAASLKARLAASGYCEVILSCQEESCGKSFSVAPRFSSKKFCSSRCLGKSQSTKTKTEDIGLSEVVRLYFDEKLSSREIAQRYKSESKWINKYLRDNGYQTRSQRESLAIKR